MQEGNVDGWVNEYLIQNIGICIANWLPNALSAQKSAARPEYCTVGSAQKLIDEKTDQSFYLPFD